MDNYWWHLADWSFLVFHTLLTLFNALGWLWRKTRKLHLVSIVLTGMSWFVLGIFYGIGYCPFTDWHFQVLRELGKTGLPNSYILYLTERITGYAPSANFVDTVTALVFFIALGLSVFLNIMDWKRKHRADK